MAEHDAVVQDLERMRVEAERVARTSATRGSLSYNARPTTERDRMSSIYDRRHPYPIVLLRRASDQHRPDAIVRMLQRCGQLSQPVDFAYHRGDDMTWAIENLDDNWLLQTMGLVEDPVDRLVGRLAVMTAHDDPVKLVYWRELRWRPFRYEIVSIDVPWAPKKEDRPVLDSREQLFELMREAAVAFGADVAGLYPRSLHALVRLASGEGARPDRGMGGDSDSIGNSLPPFVAQLPDGLFERFSQLQPARVFDAAALPEAIWWANYWSSDVVDRLGRERVTSAPWQRYEETEDGGLFLVSTRRRPAPNRPETLQAIADITEAVELPARQGEQLN